MQVTILHLYTVSVCFKNWQQHGSIDTLSYTVRLFPGSKCVHLFQSFHWESEIQILDWGTHFLKSSKCENCQIFHYFSLHLYTILVSVFELNYWFIFYFFIFLNFLIIVWTHISPTKATRCATKEFLFIHSCECDQNNWSVDFKEPLLSWYQSHC